MIDRDLENQTFIAMADAGVGKVGGPYTAHYEPRRQASCFP